MNHREQMDVLQKAIDLSDCVLKVIIEDEKRLIEMDKLRSDANRYLKLRKIANPGFDTGPGGLEDFVVSRCLDHRGSEEDFDRAVDMAVI
jgi:hypothetical protein